MIASGENIHHHKCINVPVIVWQIPEFVTAPVDIGFIWTGLPAGITADTPGRWLPLNLASCLSILFCSVAV